MVAVMEVAPRFTADVAELMPAPTFYVVAALVLLYHHLTLKALSIVQVVLEEHDLLLVTVPNVYLQKILSAELLPADLTDHSFIHCRPDDPSQFSLGDDLELVDLPVVPLDVSG